MIEAILQYFAAHKDNGLDGLAKSKGFLGEILFPMPDVKKIEKADIVIFSIDETRGAYHNQFSSNANEIRHWLYQLSQISRLNIVDLGGLIPGKTLNDSYSALYCIIEDLLKLKKLPVVIGGTNDLALSVIKAINKINGTSDVAFIDSRFDVINDQMLHSRSFLNEVVTQFGRSCKANIVGYQSYFVSSEQYNQLNDNGFDLVRLGNVRNQMNEIEPLLRDCDFVSFDMNAIRQADCPDSSYPGPNGLYTEEACQIANFAGLSDKLKVFNICELISSDNKNTISAHLAAQIIWHFIYGVSQRKNDYPSISLDNYKKIYVKIDRLDSDLVFYQNEENNRFWVEIPTNKPHHKKVVSCSESDYISLCNNQIPDRIWRNIRLMMED